MLKLKSIISLNNYGTIVWPSVAQNISLFLGGRFTKQQIYWSARYRNTFFKTIDKYFFGARFSAQNIQYKASHWRYGRFFAPEWKGMNIISTTSLLGNISDIKLVTLIKSLKASGKIIVGSISTDRKIRHLCFIKLSLSFN